MKLTIPDFTSYLRSLEFVGHTIILETDRFTGHNKVGMYPNPTSIATDPYGRPLFLSLNTVTGLSSLFMAQLHNAVQKTVKLKEDSLAKEVHHVNDIVFMVGKGGPIIFYELEQGAVRVNLGKLRSREDVVQKASELGLSANGTMAILKNRIATQVKKIEAEYQERRLSPTAINFWNTSGEESQFEELHVVDPYMIYAACKSKHQIFAVTCCSDGHGLRGEAAAVVKYQNEWGNVGSMATLNSDICISHRQGIEKVSLSIYLRARITSSGPDYCSLAPSIAVYKDGLIIQQIPSSYDNSLLKRRHYYASLLKREIQGFSPLWTASVILLMYVIQTQASLLPLSKVHVRRETQKFKLAITEKETRFEERVEINEDEQIAYFNVPPHNGLPENGEIFDYRMNVSVHRSKSDGACYLKPLPERRLAKTKRFGYWSHTGPGEANGICISTLVPKLESFPVKRMIFVFIVKLVLQLVFIS
ncbi:hypothetical protein AWC38_SpisGene13751 [Stylophora pistillata]|uniref:Uncharacterized protein n=1 Tax=Stylophora pistillata TaxID=50429 RepID=A0A2B4RX70_STYPI|nr:hypothetical protein AWC38_SpisGene13751 [Stylophora pistillata]